MINIYRRPAQHVGRRKRESNSVTLLTKMSRTSGVLQPLRWLNRNRTASNFQKLNELFIYITNLFSKNVLKYRQSNVGDYILYIFLILLPVYFYYDRRVTIYTIYTLCIYMLALIICILGHTSICILHFRMLTGRQNFCDVVLPHGRFSSPFMLGTVFCDPFDACRRHILFLCCISSWNKQEVRQSIK